jgi:hypothetical protein
LAWRFSRMGSAGLGAQAHSQYGEEPVRSHVASDGAGGWSDMELAHRENICSSLNLPLPPVATARASSSTSNSCDVNVTSYDVEADTSHPEADVCSPSRVADCCPLGKWTVEMDGHCYGVDGRWSGVDWQDYIDHS